MIIFYCSIDHKFCLACMASECLLLRVLQWLHEQAGGTANSIFLGLVGKIVIYVNFNLA